MYTLYFGNKNYSSWSLRAWVLLKAFGIPFEEQRITAVRAGFVRNGSASVSPIGQRAAVCTTASMIVWDTLAIAEYLAERHPGMWPADGGHARMGALGDGGDALGLQRAAQPIRHESARIRQRSKALAGGRQPTSRGSSRCGAKGASGSAATEISCAVRSASSTRSGARSRSASTATASRWTGAAAAYCRALLDVAGDARMGRSGGRARPSIFRCSTARRPQAQQQ